MMKEEAMSDREAIEQRLAQLKDELTEGERALGEIDDQRERLVTSMLRISGAVQVLEELLAA
jgi:hypothetical protein